MHKLRNTVLPFIPISIQWLLKKYTFGIPTGILSFGKFVFIHFLMDKVRLKSINTKLLLFIPLICLLAPLHFGKFIFQQSFMVSQKIGSICIFNSILLFDW